MKEDNIIPPNGDMVAAEPSSAPQDSGQKESNHENNKTKPKTCEIDEILDSMGVSESIATSTRAILEPFENGGAPSKSIVKLIVQALNHDEEMKNAEAAGYIRGRNETIEMATKPNNEKDSQPVNFPVYRRRSFWDM